MWTVSLLVSDDGCPRDVEVAFGMSSNLEPSSRHVPKCSGTVRGVCELAQGGEEKGWDGIRHADEAETVAHY